MLGKFLRPWAFIAVLTNGFATILGPDKGHIGVTLANIRAILGPRSKLCRAQTRLNMVWGSHLGSRRRPCWDPHWPTSGQHQSFLFWMKVNMAVESQQSILGKLRPCWSPYWLLSGPCWSRRQCYNGPRRKSIWLWTAMLRQDKGYVGVHIGHYQGHVGAGIKVIGQDKGQYGFELSSQAQHQGYVRADIKVMWPRRRSACFGQSSWAKIKTMLGSTPAAESC